MRQLLVLLGAATLAGGGWACSASVAEIADDDGGGGGPGAGGAIASSGAGGEGGNTGPCASDCSAIETPQCYHSVCNDGSHPGPVGQCVVIPDDGVACDDGQFCTTNDSCADGICVGGPPNDCGMAGGDCDEVACNEATDSCSLVPIPNGAPCSSSNLCQVGTTCQNGLCAGGSPKDCFFSPVPNECHVAVCNPANGMCEPEVGNEGQACTDLNDLCTVGKTCSNGSCGGGAPKDCSAQTVGCFNGLCDTSTGQCTQQPVPPGGACAQGNSACTVGECNSNGMCVPQPVNEGSSCNDGNPCTMGSTCTGGVCGNGAPVTQCVSNDACCPAGCTENNDSDCGCTINHALAATPSSSGGGSVPYGPENWNNGITEAQSCAQGWINNGTAPSGAWMQYDWSSPVVVGSIYVDAAPCSGATCTNGRTLAGAAVQWWNGSSWVTAGTIQNPGGGDVAFTFNPQVTTTKIRLYDVVAGNCGTQQSNTLAYEWYVWTGTSCSP